MQLVLGKNHENPHNYEVPQDTYSEMLKSQDVCARLVCQDAALVLTQAEVHAQTPGLYRSVSRWTVWERGSCGHVFVRK